MENNGSCIDICICDYLQYKYFNSAASHATSPAFITKTWFGGITNRYATGVDFWSGRTPSGLIFYDGRSSEQDSLYYPPIKRNMTWLSLVSQY